MEEIKAPNQKVIKTYKLGLIGGNKRKKEEQKLFERGFEIVSEEEIKEWEWAKSCLLALIFLPLIFIKTKKVKVTYEKTRN